MEKKKLDWIISLIREEMMAANPPGGSGGGGSQTDPKGLKGLVGFDPVMSFKRRKGPQIKLPRGQRTRWKNSQK